MKQKLIISLLSVCLLTACATKSVPQNQQSGFLDDYTLLSLTPNDTDGIKTYSYVNPNFHKSNYHAVMIAPISIYQQPTDNGISQQDIIEAKNNLSQNLSNLVSKQFNVTDKSGVGVAKVSVAISGAEISNEGFKVRNLVPVSAVLKLGSIATGLNNKQVVVLIEAKIEDSVTGEIIGEAVNQISSSTFRNMVNSKQQFTDSVNLWVKQAVTNAAGYANK